MLRALIAIPRVFLLPSSYMTGPDPFQRYDIGLWAMHNLLANFFVDVKVAAPYLHKLFLTETLYTTMVV